MADALVSALLLAAPIAGYAWAVRRGLSRARAVLAAALGGAVPGLLVMIDAALGTGAGPAPGDLLPWPLLTTATGAAIGLAGLAARSLGRWLAERP